MSVDQDALRLRVLAAVGRLGLPSSDLHKAAGIFGVFSPAFNGVLLALVRDAHQADKAWAEPIGGEWRVWISGLWLWGATEEEALTVAIEAAS